jgi:diguanylate cyclase (GGDEF)-like protein/PAS domain S-box-containing protein
MMQFRHIGHRLLASVGSVVILGIVIITVTYAMRQEKSSLQQNEAALSLVADSVTEGLAALMQGGHSKVAPDFAERLNKVPNILDYRIIRIDGTQAFIDNLTFEQVRQRNESFEFIPRSAEPVQVIAAADTSLEQLRSTGKRIFHYSMMPGGERLVTVFSPIRNEEACHKCHGRDAPLRGALTFTVSMKEVDENVVRTWQFSLLVIAAALFGSVSLIYWFAQRTVVAHLSAFLGAMETVAAGDNSLRLEARRRDEIGDMGRAFNHMNENLLETWQRLGEERNKLNTVIHSASTGIVVTDAAQQIILVNRAAELILGRSASEITDRGFLGLFDDAEWMQVRLGNTEAHSAAGLRDWKEKTLSVQASTIRNAEGQVIGSAALIRDITEEKRMEAKLEQQAITDTLTGIFNRRHFNEVLTTEFKRWKRYGQPFSVMMIDVDHFKKFNDTHGHDCGDHVLTAIGQVLLEIAAPAQIPCRYGGEEMIVVMPGVVEDGGMELAETVRSRISQLVIDGLQVTVSIGVAGLPGHAAEDGDALVKLADDALYAAKEGGRNRVCRAGPG